MGGRYRFVVTVAAAVFTIMASHRPVSAASIVLNGVAPETATIVPGQSLTTPTGDSWNDITFNFFADTAATIPAAAGTLFLLDQEYLGTPNDLSASTLGYLAQSLSIISGKYVFDSTVTLQPGTQYFLYANAELTLTGTGFGTYAGGILYAASDVSSNFDDLFGTQDAAFQLSGTVVAQQPDPAVVPEPMTLLLVGTGVARIGAKSSRRRSGPSNESV